MKSLPLVLVFLLGVFASPISLALAEEAPAPAASASVSPTPTPTPTPEPTPIPLGDIVTQAQAAEGSLEEVQPAPETEEGTKVAQDLPLVTREINTRLAETTQLLKAGVLLETLRDLEARWEKISEQLGLWARDLTTRASLIDKQLALLPPLHATWARTRESAQTAETPPEIRQRIDEVLSTVAQAESSLQKRRTALLAEQGRVAEQRKRVANALASIRSAQSAAVGRLFLPDSALIWNPGVRAKASRDLIQGTPNSFSVEFLLLRTYVARESLQFIYLALIFGALVAAAFWIRRRALKWMDDDPALERANRVLQVPIATAAVLSLFACGWLFPEPPRIFLSILAALTLAPLVLILRRLIDRHLFPIVNALVVFYVIAQLRRVVVSLPGLSRLVLLLEMIGGVIFLVWFIRFTRQASHGTISRKATRATARVGVVLFAVVTLANIFGYFRLADYLATGALVASYLAIFLYAAAGILAGLVFFALRVRPLAGLRVVKLHRMLLQERVTRIVFFVVFIIWVLLALNAFSVRAQLVQSVTRVVTAQVGFLSIHFSLGTILGFILTIWIAVLLSRFIRFLLEEDIYDRFHVATGFSYAVSTILHYVILFLGFIAAIAALGVDMTGFTVLAGAFGVGIGFGLQNIINNFVSGLILLFERPVNVGDVVQVGDATGVIRRIGIRASIIRIANSSELIVPNSQLISERVTNWTLSNRQRRIELPVGVAYGSDPRQVIELLSSVAKAHPQAAKTPEPQTIMTDFGADSLNFEVRLWTDEYDQWLQIRSDVAVAVNDALRDAKISIPFPQRDLHLQTIDPAVAAALQLRTAPAPEKGVPGQGSLGRSDPEETKR